MHGSNNVLGENPFKKISLHVPQKNKHKIYGTNKIEKLKNINMQSIKYF